MPGNIANLGPEVIAEWPTPNYNDPEERTWLPAYAAVLYAAASMMVLARLWLRVAKHAGAFGVDDAVLLAAWITSTWYTIVMIIASTKYDLGRHTWDVPLLQFQGIARITWIAEWAALISTGLVKISVLLFYQRLVAGTFSRLWKWAVYIAIALTIGYTLAFCLALIFNCSPTESYWKAFDFTWLQHHSYSCADTTAINLLSGICSSTSDMYSVVLPILMTRNVPMPIRQKIALNGVFCLGLLVVAASCVRTYNLYEVGVNIDPGWYIFNVYQWSQLELQLGIMCACAPSLRIFFRKFFNPRAMYSGRSGQSPADTLQGSELSSVAKRPRVTRPNYDDPRDDLSTRHLAIPSYDETVAGDVERGQGSMSLSGSHDLIKTPSDYEAYNLQNMDSCRESAIRSPSTGSLRAIDTHELQAPEPHDLRDTETLDLRIAQAR